MTEEEVEQQQSKYWHRFWTIPNLFTLFRIMSSIGLVSYLAMNGLSPLTLFGVSSTWWLPVWAVATASSDFIDGGLARKLHQQSKWGQALDPIADKILNWGIALSLMFSKSMPLWVLAIGIRDIMVGVFTVKKKYEDGKKQSEKEIALKDRREDKSSLLDKVKQKYQTFQKGEAPNPTYPAKMKMALQSLGGIATLAFGFGKIHLWLLGSVMALSMTSMILLERIPLSSKAKRMTQFLSTMLVDGIAVCLGGPALIAPIMMGSAISMVVPEMMEIRKSTLQEKKSKPVTTVPKCVCGVVKQEQPQLEKQIVTVLEQPKIDKRDYRELDRLIEEEMVRKHVTEVSEEKPKQKQYHR